MDNLNKLKPALFGRYYDKQSVLNYIFELNNNAKAVQERLSAQFDDLGAAREKLTEAIRELEQKLSDSEKARGSLGEELKGERVKNGEMSKMLEALNSEIERQNKIIAQKTSELSRVDEIRAELDEKRAELAGKNKIIEEKMAQAAEAADIRLELEKARALLEEQGEELVRVREAVREEVPSAEAEALRAELGERELELMGLREELDLLRAAREEEGGLTPAEVEGLRQELEEERTEVRRRKSEIERYRKELAERDSQLNDGAGLREAEALRREIERLRGETDRLKRKLTGREAEIAHLRGRDEEAERASRYVNELILQAKEDAERIIGEANIMARQAAVEVTRSLDGVCDQFSRFRREMRDLEEKTGEAIARVRQTISSTDEAAPGSESGLRGFYRPPAQSRRGPFEPHSNREQSFFPIPPARNGGTAFRTGKTTTAPEPAWLNTPAGFPGARSALSDLRFYEEDERAGGGRFSSPPRPADDEGAFYAEEDRLYYSTLPRRPAPADRRRREKIIPKDFLKGVSEPDFASGGYSPEAAPWQAEWEENAFAREALSGPDYDAPPFSWEEGETAPACFSGPVVEEIPT
ncbi:MAG: hypothetical protein LBU86_06095, partial [Oscillospiraceae bacterium]|nr:hypothetical protein [Oscillospiraceae bacterium]